MSWSAESVWPKTVFVDAAAKEDALTKRILSRLPNVDVIELAEGSGDPISQRGQLQEPNIELSDPARFTLAKRALYLTRYQGNWLKSCPGTSDHVCCNLWIVNPGEGCPMDCTYCYLQSYLRRNPTSKLYTNTTDMLSAILAQANKEPSRLFRIGTGELMDSLVWDPLTDLSCELVPFFARVPNLMLELKTKSANVENLLKLKNEHQGKTVVSWSVNARTISENDEAFTARLEERVQAAEKVVEAGYKVGFHFDPLVSFPGWQDEYRDTIKLIFSRIKPEQVAWVSVSSLRYQQEMQDMMMARFPKSTLPFGEQFLAKDRKLRYIQPLRFQLIQFVWDELKSYGVELPVYMCMESSTAWRTIAGAPPSAGEELREVFSRRGRLPILQQKSC